VIKRAAAAILIFYSGLVIQRAMPDLPERIPTRFDIHGHPASVSRPETLWLFLAAQALIVGVFLALPYFVRRAPHQVSLSGKRLSDFVPNLRDQILLLIDGACGWMAVGFALFMTILIRQIIRAAIDPRQGPSIWFIPVFLVVLMAVFGYYAWKYIELDKNSAPVAPAGGIANTYPQPPRNPGSKK
jgi:uncharacterized membrane protein